MSSQEPLAGERRRRHVVPLNQFLRADIIDPTIPNPAGVRSQGARKGIGLGGIRSLHPSSTKRDSIMRHEVKKKLPGRG